MNVTDFSHSVTAISSIAVGIVLLIQGAFMITLLTADRTIYPPVRHLLMHHSVLYMVVSVCMLMSGVISFALSQDEQRCLWSRIARDVTETALEWHLTALALCGVALHHPQGLLHRAVICKTGGQLALVAAVWTLSGVTSAGMYAIPRPFLNTACGRLSHTSLAVSTASDVGAYMLLLLFTVLTLSNFKRLARLVSNKSWSETIDRQLVKEITARVQLKGTLGIFCAIAVSAHLGSILARLYNVSHRNPDGTYTEHGLTLLVSVLAMVFHVLLFPLLLFRHRFLCRQIKRSLLRKCFVNSDDSFTCHVDLQHQMRESYRQKMHHDSDFRMSVRKLRESKE